MARQYRRDARGRFASGGYSGQTGGRGARLMAKNTRAGGGAKIQAGKVGGTISKAPGKRSAPKPAPKPAAKEARPKWEKTAGFAGRRSSAQIAKGLTGVTHDNGGSFSASILRTGKQSQAPRMERKGFRNVTEARKWAMNPSARGDRLMRRKYGSEAAPDASGFRRRGRIANTLRKPKGLKPDPQAKKRGTRGSLNREGVLGKTAQRRGLQQAAQGAMQRLGIKDSPSTQRKMARPSGILSKRVGGMKVSGSVTRNDHARVTRGLGRAERKAAGPRAGQAQRARQRALVNYNKALRKTASLDAGKRSDVAMATSRRALDAYAGKTVKNPKGFTSNGSGTAKPALSSRGKVLAAKPAAPAPANKGRMKPLRGVGAAVAGNLKGFRGLPVVIRSRSQAAAAQRDRTRMTIERSRANYGTPKTQSAGGSGIKLNRVKVDQPNFLTGRTDRMTVAIRAKETGSMAKDSSATRRANRRLARAEARYEQLLSNRETVRKGRNNIISTRQLTRESKVVDAMRSYRDGGGRKRTRKTSGGKR